MDSYRFSTGNEIVELPLKADVKKIYIEPTTVCNYTCVTCIRHSWGDELAPLPKKVFDKIIADSIEFPELETVHFGGFGEPLTHPDILTMIAECKKNGYQAEMITNGSLLTAQIIESLIECELDWLFVSLDGPSQDSFAKIRPGAHLESVVDNIKLLQEMKQRRDKIKPRLGIEFVATKKNVDKLPAMRRLVDSLGAHKFIITNVLPYHESMKDEIIYNSLFDRGQFGWESPLLSVKSAPNMELRTLRSCKFVETKSLAINYKGEVCPCYSFMHNYSCYIFGRKKEMKAHSFGNILDRTLRDIWTDPSYAVFRWTVRMSHYPSCTDCKQKDGCKIAETNEIDCWGNQPSCADCLWARDIIVCP